MDCVDVKLLSIIRVSASGLSALLFTACQQTQRIQTRTEDA